MRKLMLMLDLVLGFAFSLAVVSASCYGYGCQGGYYDGYYNDMSYHKSNSYGSLYGPQYTKTVDYNKYSDTVYLGYGAVEQRTVYTKTVKETPRYYYHPSYYYSANDYYPWYQRYWTTPTYGNYRYSSQPVQRTYYYYNY